MFYPMCGLCLDPDTNKIEDFFKRNLSTDWTLDNIKELLFILFRYTNSMLIN